MVMAAGLGTRLRPITWEIPKPVVPVCNRPIAAHLVQLLSSHGFDQVIANLHWFPETITGYFGDGSDFGIELSYSPEEALLGTAGGVRNASHFFDGDFLVISGDALTDIDLLEMVGRPVAVYPDEGLRAVAEERGWKQPGSPR